MKLKFWSLIGKQMIQVHSFLGVLISLVISFLLWQNKPEKTVPLFYLLVLIIISLFLIVSLIGAVLEVLKHQNYLPKIESVIRARNGDILCLLQNSGLFSHGIAVSFFYTNEQNFEQLVCIGTVINIQENGKIQAKIENYLDVHEDIIERLKNNDSQLIKKITVKPSVPAEI